MSLECLRHDHQIARHGVDHLVDRFALGHHGHRVLRWVPHFAGPISAALGREGKAQPGEDADDPGHDHKASILGTCHQYTGDLVIEQATPGLDIVLIQGIDALEDLLDVT